MNVNRAQYFLAILLTSVSVFGQAQKKIDDQAAEPGITMRHYNEANEQQRWEIGASYPELRLAQNAPANGFNKTAKELVMKHIAEFKSGMSEISPEERKAVPDGISYYLEIGYVMEYVSNDFISVGFGRGQYTGGAHPNRWAFTLNYDLTNSRVLKLDDLFTGDAGYISVISQDSIAQISAAQGESADHDWIAKGAGAKSENFSSWNITANGLKFTFDPYQVGPYVAGSFETLVPHEKFSAESRSPLYFRVLGAAVIEQDSANWCRNGLFPGENTVFRLAAVKGQKREPKERIYFHRDDSGCPAGNGCRTNAYVIPRDEVIVSRRSGDYICAWYQPKKGSETVGWILADNLVFNNATKSPPLGMWIGKWESNGNSLEIALDREPGLLAISGNAFWQGLGDNIHIGEVDDKGSPKGDLLNIGGPDKYDCRVKMQIVGKFLVVSDNMMCGGANVTFTGVYQKMPVQ